MLRKKNVIALLGAAFAVSLVFSAQPGDAFAQQTIKIGGLILDDPSNFNDLGREKVIEYAVSNFNAEQAALNTEYRIEYIRIPVMFNTAGLPHEQQDVYKKVSNAYSNGIKYFVGPSPSSLALTAKTFTDTTRDAILVSPSSTAPSLATANDSLFRLTHDDTAQAPELINITERDGKEHLIFVQREDVWGEGLYKAISSIHQGGEARVVMKPAGSAVPASYYSDVAVQLKGEVERLASQYGANSVGVVLILFDSDTINLVEAALGNGADNVLSSVSWYGTDGIAGNSNLVRNAPVADFLSTVRLVSTIFQASENPTSLELARHVEQFSGFDFAYRNSVYDATYLLADTVIVEKESDVADILARELILSVAGGSAEHPHHHASRNLGDGALGAYTLNAAGDLSEPRSYAVLRVVGADGSYGWTSSSAGICR